jgi:hypothetical protein
MSKGTASSLGFITYWVAWCLIAVRGGYVRGAFEESTQWHYPISGVFAVSAFVGILIGILYAILRPTTYSRSWGRLLVALIYSAALVYLAYRTTGTDQPGYSYIPAMFALVNMALVVFFAAIQGGLALFKVGRHAA